MTEASKIRDFLNELIKDQPEIAELLNQGILANQAICDRKDIRVRPTEQGGIVTITGIITAISEKYGEALASLYEGEPRRLLGFGVYSEGLPRTVLATPEELFDGSWVDPEVKTEL